MAALFTNVPVKTVPAAPFITSGTTTQGYLGPDFYGSARWGAGDVIYLHGDPNFGQNPPSIIKSTDGGDTWTQSIGPFGVNANNNQIDSFFTSDGLVHFLAYQGNGDAHLSYVAYDRIAPAWGVPVNAGPIAGNSLRFAKRLNGDLLAIYEDTVTVANVEKLRYVTISAGAWSAPTDIVATVPLSLHQLKPVGLLMDAAGTAHILYQDRRATAPASNELWYVTLTAGGAIGTPVLIDNAFTGVDGSPLQIGQGIIWSDRLLWATVHQSTPSVILYEGTPVAAPVWARKVAVTPLLNQVSGPGDWRAQVILVGSGPQIFYMNQPSSLSSTFRQLQYCTYDGATFGAPQLAWDCIANPAVGDPNAPDGISAFSVAVIDDGSGEHLEGLADEFIDSSFNQTLVFLAAASVPLPLSIICAAPPAGVVGDAYSHAFPASGGTAPYTYAIIAGALPTGLSLNASTGVASGTPTVPGVFSFTVQVTDALLATASVACSITITAIPAVSIICNSPPSGMVGDAYSHAFPASSGTPPYTYSISSGALPPGVTLDASTGVASGIPLVAGLFAFTVRVIDSLASIASVLCTILITDIPPTELTLACGNPPSGQAGSPYYHLLLISGGVQPYEIIISAGALPPGLSMGSMGQITGVPNFPGTWIFTVRVTDTALTRVFVTCSITITSPPSPVCTDHHDDVHPYQAHDQPSGCPDGRPRDDVHPYKAND